MMRDKAVGEVLDLLAEELDTIVVTSMPEIPIAGRGRTWHWRRGSAPGGPLAAANPTRALDVARGLAEQAGPDAVVLVVGSVYLAGQVRARLTAEDADLP